MQSYYLFGVDKRYPKLLRIEEYLPKKDRNCLWIQNLRAQEMISGTQNLIILKQPPFIMQPLSRKAEDYLEAILNVSSEKGYARTRDIARELGIQPPTVVEMVQKLDKAGMIVYRKYDGVTLTDQGKRIAEVIRDRHVTLRTFLELVRVPHTIAEKDACMMEHELSPETIEQIRTFIAFCSENPQAAAAMKHFPAFASVKTLMVQQ